MTGEDGGVDEGFNPDNPAGGSGGGGSNTGEPDGGKGEAGNDAMTGCVAGREICGDGLDNDCDQLADERCACDEDAEQQCYDGPQEFAGIGQCVFGAQACIANEEFSEWGDCEGAQRPVIELCNNGLDDDCDGKADEGCVCEPDETRACYGGTSATRGVGACQDGTLTCLDEGDEGAWSDDCVGEVLPGEELCGNDVDEDCDGELDNGCACEPDTREPCYSGSEDTRGVGACEDGMRTCEVEGGEATWGGCTGDVLPAAEVCGNDVDEDCDGQLDNDCSELTCPADMTVPASNPVTLTATGSGVTNYAFTIADGPAGGPATATWANVSGPSADLTPIIIGEYTVRVTAQNGAGDPLECSFTVTALPHGLRVQLYWDGTGDVDLHLHNANMTPWSMPPAPDDTYWANLMSTWGGVLDIDNRTMNGPENITVDNPVIGMPYTIAVHNWANAEGRTASVNVFCGDTASTTPQQSFTSRPLVGTESGYCSNNDFWRVARVTFTSLAACTIETIDQYQTAAAACAAF